MLRLADLTFQNKIEKRDNSVVYRSLFLCFTSVLKKKKFRMDERIIRKEVINASLDVHPTQTALVIDYDEGSGS